MREEAMRTLLRWIAIMLIFSCCVIGLAVASQSYPMHEALTPVLDSNTSARKSNPQVPARGIHVVGPAMLRRPLAPQVIAHDALAVQALTVARARQKGQPPIIESRPVMNVIPGLSPTPMFPGILPSHVPGVPVTTNGGVRSRLPNLIGGRPALTMRRMIPGTNYDLTVLGNSPSEYYRLDETSGSTANDSHCGTIAGDNSCQGLPGSYVGAVTLNSLPGPIYNESATGAVSIPGGAASVGVSVPNPTATSGTSYSIETWVYPILASSYLTIWGFNGSARLLVNTSGRLLSQFSGNYFSTGTLTANAWHHVVYEYDASTQKASYYIDGVFDSTYPTTISNAAAALNSAYYLGQYDTSANYKWNGKLGQQAFYKSVLTAAQVLRDYQVGSGVAPSPTPTPLPTSATGAFPWWSFVSDRLGGVGQYGVNLANSNLIVQAADMGVPNKGVELGFARVYNSLSQHDYAGSDGSTRSNYGNGWTNTFDAHLGYDSQLGTLSVYDSDGTRYDYNSNGTGCWTRSAGVFATLCSDGANGYFWTQKNGVTLYFYSPVQQPNNAGFAGRLFEVFGRNQNNSLTFTYSWDNGDSSSSTKLSSVAVTTEDQRNATLQFRDFSGYRLLYTLVWPNGTQVTYNYDTSADLIEVDEPGNNAGSMLFQKYAWQGTHQLQQVSSPRYIANPTGSNTGSYYVFGYTGSQLTSVTYYGAINPITSDPYNTTIQPSMSTGVVKYRSLTLQNNGSSNTVIDSDGHQGTYYFDQLGRVTQAKLTTGDPPGGVSTITLSQTWNAQNLVISATDARGNESDLDYDAQGNLIAAAQPATGAFRGTSFFSYDSSNNLIAVCDPAEVHAQLKDWTATPVPSDSLCSSQNMNNSTQFSQYTYAAPSDGSEPFGRLTTITKPSGYQYTVGYDNTAQGGRDYGLETSITGSPFPQINASPVAPQTSVVYNSSGDVVCYNSGSGVWAYSYNNNIGLVTTIGDPDDSSLSVSACNKTPGLSGSHITTSIAYYPNGQLQTVQSSAQYPAGVNSTIYYDADGNPIQQSNFYGHAIASPLPAEWTYFWYDAAERLVEVELPTDSANDFYKTPWLTKYFYDLTQNGSLGSVSISGVATPTPDSATYVAHGNLFKRQTFVPAAIQNGDSSVGTTGSWFDVAGTAYDALNRPTANYFFAPNFNGPSGTLEGHSSAYDTSSQSYGLLSSHDSATYTYDNIGRMTATNYSWNPHGPWAQSANQTFAYDADGRTVSVGNANFTNPMTLAYDTDGNIIQAQDPSGISGVSMSEPATITVSNYPNGWSSALTVAIPAPNATSLPNLITYAYRADGRKINVSANYKAAYQFHLTYTSAGRLLTNDASNPYGYVNYGYNTYGQLNSEIITGGGPATRTYSNFTYDAEGELAHYFAGQSVPIAYDSRGQAIYQDKSANGFMYPNDVQLCFVVNPLRGTENCGYQITDFDARVAAPIGSLWTPAPTPIPKPSPINGQTNYNTDGQQTGTTTNASTNYDRIFDVNDYLTQTISSGSVTYNYTPAPNYRILVAHKQTGITDNYDITLHWSPFGLLFTTRGDGVINDVKINDLGEIFPNDAAYSGLNAYDYDPLGWAAGVRNSTGTSEWDAFLDPAGSCGSERTQAAATGAYISPGQLTPNAGLGCSMTNAFGHGIMFARRADQYTNGDVRFQGARTYDEGTATWTTPDVYPGALGNPISQLAYAYDNNNPAIYMDPSGFDGCTTNAPENGSFCFDFLLSNYFEADIFTTVKCGGWVVCISGLRPCGSFCKQALQTLSDLFASEWQAIKHSGPWGLECLTLACLKQKGPNVAPLVSSINSQPPYDPCRDAKDAVVALLVSQAMLGNGATGLSYGADVTSAAAAVAAPFIPQALEVHGALGGGALALAGTGALSQAALRVEIPFAAKTMRSAGCK